MIFDEPQTIPLRVLRPCVQAIGALVREYGVTAVLCTAIQPALGRFFPEGMKMREICPDSEGLYKRFRRARLLPIGRQSLEAVAGRMSGRESALAVLTTRKQAYELFAALPKHGRFHLVPSSI